MNISQSILDHYKDLLDGNGLKISALPKDDLQKLVIYAMTQINEKLKVLDHNLGEILKSAEAQSSKEKKWKS